MSVDERKLHPDYRAFRYLMSVNYDLPQLRHVLQSDAFKRFAALYPKDSPGRDPSGVDRKATALTKPEAGTPQ